MPITCPKTKKVLEDTRDSHWCDSCEQEVDELGTKRECSRDSCGNEFVAQEGDGRNCPDCNNPFTRLVEEEVCPDCEEQVTETEVADCEDCGEAHAAESEPEPESSILTFGKAYSKARGFQERFPDDSTFRRLLDTLQRRTYSATVPAGPIEDAVKAFLACEYREEALKAAIQLLKVVPVVEVR